MTYTIVYHSHVVHDDIPRIPKSVKARLQRAIRQKLSDKPEVYGKPLQYSLKGYRCLRVGSYRVVFRIQKNTVKILIIQHRSVVYKDVKKRIRNA
jgi:mRNA interferase RelE/StbE